MDTTLFTFIVLGLTAVVVATVVFLLRGMTSAGPTQVFETHRHRN